VIQPARCKPFGPALNGENRRKPPCGVRPFEVGGEGAALGPPFLLVLLTWRTREVLSHTGDTLYRALRCHALLRNSTSSTEFRYCAPIRILKRVISPRADPPCAGLFALGPALFVYEGRAH